MTLLNPEYAALLTRRQKDVAELLIRGGLGNKQIAAELGLSVYTVNSHLNRMMRRLGADDRLQLALVLAGVLPVGVGKIVRMAR